VVQDTFTRSLWYATAAPGPRCDALEGQARADVAIVGAGILGLSTALHLAEAGAKVVVVEAREPGYGASGRNGGFVVPAFPVLDPDMVRRRLGPEQGEALARMVGESADLVFALIRRHAIDCDAVQAGWMSPTPMSALTPRIESRVRQWQALGRPARALDADEVARMTGIGGYRAALFDPTGGHLNPLAYVRGLARAAQAAGVRIHGDSPVLRIVPASRWRIETARGSVTAEHVLVCTNASPSLAAPDGGRAAARSVVPLNIYQAATVPLPDAVGAAVMPSNAALSDMRRNLFTVHAARDRLITGAMAMLQPGALGRLPRLMERRMKAHFPTLATAPMEFVWHGTASITPDFLPRLFALGPGLIAPVACNGRGIGLTTALGAALAAWLRAPGQTTLPLSLVAPKPISFYPWARHAPAALLPYYKLCDWRDEREGT
jgi:glycine/D-amino acid oxidase-like deaminating enzyme